MINLNRSCRLGIVSVFLLLNLWGLSSCTAEKKEVASNVYRGSYLEADYFGLYYITGEHEVMFVPLTERAQAYGKEQGILDMPKGVSGISAEGDGYIGVVFTDGTFDSTCDITDLGAALDTENFGTGSAGLTQVAQGFEDISDVSSFHSMYPSWGLFAHENGTVTVPSCTEHHQIEMSKWADVVQLAGTQDVVGMTSSGGILYLEDSPYQALYQTWDNITGLYCGYATDVFATTTARTVLFAGVNHWGEGDVAEWNDIIDIAPSLSFTVGLRSDGTVVATGDNSKGQCNVSTWKNIVAVAVAEVGDTAYTVGIDKSGTVWVAGTIGETGFPGTAAVTQAKDFCALASNKGE